MSPGCGVLESEHPEIRVSELLMTARGAPEVWGEAEGRRRGVTARAWGGVERERVEGLPATRGAEFQERGVGVKGSPKVSRSCRGYWGLDAGEIAGLAGKGVGRKRSVPRLNRAEAEFGDSGGARGAGRWEEAVGGSRVLEPGLWIRLASLGWPLASKKEVVEELGGGVGV